MTEIFESQPFHGSVDEIRMLIQDNSYYGKQVVIIYFGSIGGRQHPERYQWKDQPESKKDHYETGLLSLARESFSKYPVIIAAMPPHAGTLFAFGSPLLNQSEVNTYKLATLDVTDMTVNEPTLSPENSSCPLDYAIIAYELEMWNRAGTLDEYIGFHRDPRDVNAKVANPNKVSSMLKKSIY